MKQKIKPFLLLLPQLLLAVVFMAGLITGITQSFGVIPAFGLEKPTLKYYQEIIEKKELAASIRFSLYTAFVSACLSTILGVFFCAVLTAAKKTKGLLIRIVQLPMIIPHVVVAMFAINICSQNGLLARSFYAMGWITEQQQFPQLIYDRGGWGIIIAYLWKEIPFIIYFVLALMANINNGFGEAAMNLGAGRWKAFFKVTLPLCMHTILSGFLIIFVFALGAYEIPQLLGPTLPKALPVAAYVQYIHPDLQNRPYAMAMNGILILISLAAAGIYFILIRKQITDIKGKKK